MDGGGQVGGGRLKIIQVIWFMCDVLVVAVEWLERPRESKALDNTQQANVKGPGKASGRFKDG